MMPRKNTKATEARIRPVVLLLGFSADMANLGASTVSIMKSKRTAASVELHLTSGGVSNVCQGAGDGTVHSRPSAPSQGFAGAGSPFWKYQAFKTM